MNVDVIIPRIWRAIEDGSYREIGNGHREQATQPAIVLRYAKKIPGRDTPHSCDVSSFITSLNRNIPVDPENLPIFTRPFFPRLFFLSSSF